MSPIKVAAIQAAPVMHDLPATLSKALGLIRDAAHAGAQLIVFPELFLPGYAWWLWTEPYLAYAGKIGPYVENCPAVGGREYTQLHDLAKQLGVHVVMGVAERHGGSLYIAQWIFGPEGVVANRRKLKPTAVERVLYGEGDGSDLKVHPTSIGRLGALNCWEHAQPLIKHVMACQHEEIHCASWPTFFPESPHLPLFGVGRTANTAFSRVYALEVGCFVVAATAPFTPHCLDVIAGDNEMVRQGLGLGGGASMIFDSHGKEMAEQLEHTAEGILYADVDVSARGLSKSALDPVGHYSRPDVFKVSFDTRPKNVVNVGAHGTEKPEVFRKIREEQFEGERIEATSERLTQKGFSTVSSESSETVMV